MSYNLDALLFVLGVCKIVYKVGLQICTQIDIQIMCTNFVYKILFYKFCVQNFILQILNQISLLTCIFPLMLYSWIIDANLKI